MRWLTGERVLAVLFAVFGLIFVLEARKLTYMDEFAPGAGFLPFWLGILLVVLVAAFVWSTREAKTEADAWPAGGRKAVAVAVGLIACIAVIDWLGFVVAIAAYVIYLVRGVERRSWLFAIALAVGTTLSLYSIFRLWLGVPLPQGPWGF